jgi:hypothetical protein
MLPELSRDSEQGTEQEECVRCAARYERICTAECFARRTWLSLAAEPKEPPIRAKENSRYELAQSQNALTETGLLMEGHFTY